VTKIWICIRHGHGCRYIYNHGHGFYFLLLDVKPIAVLLDCWSTEDSNSIYMFETKFLHFRCCLISTPSFKGPLIRIQVPHFSCICIALIVQNWQHSAWWKDSSAFSSSGVISLSHVCLDVSWWSYSSNELQTALWLFRFSLDSISTIRIKESKRPNFLRIFCLATCKSNWS
jgi:hypothetical protein